MDSFFQSMQASLINGNASLSKAYIIKSINRGFSIESIVNSVIEPTYININQYIMGQAYPDEERLLCIRALNVALKTLTEYVPKVRKKQAGIALIFPLSCDEENIGRQICALAYFLSGFQVKEVDVTYDLSEIESIINRYLPQVVSLYSSNQESLSEIEIIIDAINKCSQRSKLKIAISGGTDMKDFSKYVGADIYVPRFKDILTASEDLKDNVIGKYNLG